jgi:hypothetical protein
MRSFGLICCESAATINQNICICCLLLLSLCRPMLALIRRHTAKVAGLLSQLPPEVRRTSLSRWLCGIQLRTLRRFASCAAVRQNSCIHMPYRLCGNTLSCRKVCAADCRAYGPDLLHASRRRTCTAAVGGALLGSCGTCAGCIMPRVQHGMTCPAHAQSCMTCPRVAWHAPPTATCDFRRLHCNAWLLLQCTGAAVLHRGPPNIILHS